MWGVRGWTLSHPRLPALWAGCRGAWGVRGRALSHPGLPALWAGCCGRCGASGVGHFSTPDCPPSGRAAGAGVGRPGSDALPPPTARPLGGLPGPVWGVRGRTLSHPRLPALWAGCRGWCGASGVGCSPTPDCPPSERAAGAGVGRPGSGALPPPTARPLGGLPGPVWGVRGRTLSHPRLLALWAGCRGRCGASGVGRSPTPDCSPSGRAAGAGVGRPGSAALPSPTARPLGGLPGPVWGVRGRALSNPGLLALCAGCRGPCGASGVGRSPTPDCPPSGRAAGAGVGRPGSGALPTPTARPLGGLPGPVWGVRGRALSHPRLLALWAGCRGRCGASGVGHSPTPDCPPSGRAAGTGVGRPGLDALPPPTARPLGGLPGRVGRPGLDALQPRLPALWAGCGGRCGASMVRRSPTPDCSPSGRAAGAVVGRPGLDTLPPPTARPLGWLPGSVWGVRGRALSHPRLPALWAGCRGAWGVRGRALSHPGLPALWAGCCGRCGASGVGRFSTPDCPPSGRAAGAGVGRPGSGALPTPTARPLRGLPGPVWGVRGRTLSDPRLPALWAGRRGRCGASGVGRSPTPDCSPSGRAAGAGVGRPGSDALPPPTARSLGGLPGSVWGVRGRTLSHPRLLALWAGCRGRCGASGVGRSPTPDCSPSGRAAGAGVGRPGLDTLPPPTARPLGGLLGRVGRPGSGALPPPTARPLGGLLGPVWGVRGRALFHPRLPALWAGCGGRCGASGVGRSPTPDCSPSGRAAGAGVGRPRSDALPPRTARPLGRLPGPVWGVRGRALSHPRLLALWAGCRGRCGAFGVGRSPTFDCPRSGRAAGAGVGCPGSGALPPPTARPLGGLPGPVWGVRGPALSHPRRLALWAGCRGRCGASGVGNSPTPDCPPSWRAAGAGVGRPGSGALPPPTARPLGGLPGPLWVVRGWTLSHPRLPALWAGCRDRCGASGVGRSPTPTARPLGGLRGPVWGVHGQALSHPQLLALWAGCRGRRGSSGVGHSPTPDCAPSGRAAGVGVGRPGLDALPPPTARPLGGLQGRVGRPGSGALPPPTARPLGGLLGPVWSVRCRALFHPRLPALWAGCRGRCGASGVGRSPTPDCSPSGRAAGAGVGRPGSEALPAPTARPLGGLPGPVWGVRGRALSHPRLLALWAGCRGRCGAFGVGRSPTPDCPPSGRAAGAGVGCPGSGALPPPTARPLGGLPGPVWGVRGPALSRPRRLALWAGYRGRCGASGVGRSPTPDCPPSGRAAWACGASGVGRSPTPDCLPSGRAAGAGVGRPGSGTLPPPTARPLGGLPGSVWGVQGRALSHPRLPALWAGCRGRCGASGTGCSPIPDCPPSGRAAGVGVGRPGSGALLPPTARPLSGLPGPVWGVRGRTLSHPRLPALWTSCRGRCGASGVGRSPTPDCSPSGQAAGAGVGRPGPDALPPPTARPLGGLQGSVWGVQGRALSHPRLLALWAGCRGRCGASGVGRSPTPDCSPSGRAAGAGVGRPGSGALPPPTARPLGGLLGPVWGVRGRTLSQPRLPALWAGCRGRCGASGVGRSPTPDCPSSGRAAGACGASGVGRSPTPDCLPSGRAAGAGVGRPGSGALLPPTARPLSGLPGPVWGVRGRTLSHPRLPALWAGCRGVWGVRSRALSHPRLPAPWAGCWGLCGASGVGRSPTPNCPPSGRAARVGVGRPGSGALPPPTARPLGRLPGPVWGVRGRMLSQPRLPALWEGCRIRCGASGVGRSPTPDCSPSGRAAGAGVGRPGSDALPPPTARPLGGLPRPVWGVRGRALSQPRLLALWAGCRGRCGASGVGRSPSPDCPPSGRAAGAGVGRPGSGALPPPTARPLGGLPGPVWGVRGRTLSHPRLPALWAGCRGRCVASGVRRSPTPNCSPSGRAAGAGVGRPGSGALPPPTARPLGGLPGPVWGVRGWTLSHPRLLALWAGCRGAWGVRGRALSHPRLPALWAGCWGRCGASGVGRSSTPDCPPSGRAAGAGVGRPGSGALPPPTARPLGGLPGPVWGVRGRTLSQPRLPALWAGCRGRCGASGVGRSPTPDCSHSGRAAGAGVGRSGSDALPPPTARLLGGLPGPVWGVRGRALSHPRLLALWAGCRGRCGASGVRRSPTPDGSPSGQSAGAGVGRPGLDALPPPTARPLGGLPGRVGRPGSGALPPPTACPLGGLPGPGWGVRGRALSHPQLPALWAGCRGRCGASRGGRSPTPGCPPSGRAAGVGVGRPGSGALLPPTARPLSGLPGPVWGVRGRTLSHPRLPALWAGCRGVWGVRSRALSHPRLPAPWAGCRGRCGASGAGCSPIPDCPPSGRAAGVGVGRPGSGALLPPTARPLSGLPGPVWGVRGRTLSHPRLPALWAGCRGVWGVRSRALSHPRLPAPWAGCRGRCGASGVGRSPTPNCPPSGRAAGVGVGRPGSGALPPPTARPLGRLPGPVWGVRGQMLSHPRLPALWAGCRGRCGASGVGRSPTPDCSPSGRAAGAGVGRPGSGALPPPTARPLGGLPGPVWGVRGRALSHPRLLALWAGCRGRCGASGVGRSPTPDCSPSGRAAGAGVGRPGSDALPPPTARPLGGLPGRVGRPESGALPPPTACPLGGLPGPVWGVRGRALSHPQLPALWTGCRGRCGASGVGRSPTPDCSPSGQAAGAGVGRPGPDALPPPTARPLGGLPDSVWGVRGRALSHPRLLALWAGCRGRCGASGVGRSPTPDCSPSGRAAGAGVGRPGSGALPPPTARPLGGLPGPVWGVRGRKLSHPRLPAFWAGCRGRCGASGVGRSPTPDCSPSGRAAGAGVGRPGSDALPPPTARSLGGLPGPVCGVRGQALSHPQLPALWAGCRGRCGASGVGRSLTPDCSPSGRAAGAGVGRPGLDALPPPTARPLGGLRGPVWGVHGRTLSHRRLLALWAGCRGRCGSSGVGHSPVPDCPPSGRAAGTGVGHQGLDALPPPTARPLGGLPGRVGRPGSGALPPPTARPLGGLLGPVWGVRGRALSHPQLPALWAGCGAAVRVRALLGRVGRAGIPGAFWCASRFLWPFLLRSLLARPPPGWGCPVCGCCSVSLPLVPPPPLFFFFSSPPSVRPVVPCFACFPALGALGLGVLLPPPLFFVFFWPPPSLLYLAFPAFRLPLASAPPPPPPPPPPPVFVFFSLPLLFFLLRVCCVCSGVSCCVFPVLPVRCAVRVVCAVSGGWCCWFLVSLPFVGGPLVALVARRCCLVVCVGSGARVWSGRRWASSLWCSVPLCCVLWRCAAVWCCAVVPCLLFFFLFFVFLPAGGAGFLLFPSGSGLQTGSGSFLFLCSACAVLCWCACAVVLCSVLSCPRGAGWCFVLLPVVFVCLLSGLAVLCCLLVGPGGSWCRVSVACCGVSHGAVLRRVAARCAAWRCVVVHCVVSFCSVWCCRAPCCVLGRCPLSWGPVPSGAVFCLVPPRCVCFAVVCRCVVLFAVVLCAVCALGCRVVRFLSSPPRAVLLCGPLSLGALLPCAVPRGAVLPRGAVVSCPAALLGLFLAWVWLYLLGKPLQIFVKYFSLFFFGF